MTQQGSCQLQRRGKTLIWIAVSMVRVARVTADSVRGQDGHIRKHRSGNQYQLREHRAGHDFHASHITARLK